MNPERKFGPRMRRLIALCAARVAIPPGGWFAEGMAALSSKEAIMETTRKGIELADAAITAMRAAAGNPYGDDEEVLAGVILDKAEKGRT